MKLDEKSKKAREKIQKLKNRIKSICEKKRLKKIAKKSEQIPKNQRKFNKI